MSKQHANAGDAGQYKYTHAEIEKQFEQRQTLSLYNLLDHSPSALRHLRDAIRNEIWRIEKEKLTKCDTYTDLCAFSILIDSAGAGHNPLNLLIASITVRSS